MVDGGIGAHGLFDPLALAVVDILADRSALVGDPDQAVVEIVDQCLGVSGGDVAHRIVAKGPGPGAGDPGQLVGAGFVGIGIGLPIQSPGLPVAHLVVGVTDGAVEAGRAGEPIEVIVAEGLAAGGIQVIRDVRDIADCIEIIGVVHETSGGQVREHVALVELAGDRRAAAHGHIGQRAERQVGDVRGYGAGKTVFGGRNPRDVPGSVAGIRHRTAVRIGHAGQQADRIVFVSGGVGHPGHGLLHRVQVPVHIVPVYIRAGRIGHTGQAAQAVYSFVVAVGDILGWVGEDDICQAVEDIVCVGDDCAAGIGLGRQVAGRIVTVGRGAGVRGDLLLHPAKIVVMVDGGQVLGIGHG